MAEQIIQVLERKTLGDTWKIRTVIQLWPKQEDERTRLFRFIDEIPKE